MKYVVAVERSKVSHVRIEAPRREVAEREALKIAGDEDNIYVDMDYDHAELILGAWLATDQDYHREFYDPTSVA